MPLYGQIVVGPPGSGKTTYCNGMQQYLRLLGRNCYVVNLDPANELPPTPSTELPQEKEENDNAHLPYQTIFDICTEVINLSSVMEQLELGPNGGLLYCMEYIQTHVKDILSLLRSRIEETTSSQQSDQRVYLLFDLPGQVELYTHCDCIQSIFASIVKTFDARLCVVQLLDSTFCIGNPERYISGVLWCLSSMIRLELPTVNVLSKIDLLAVGEDNETALGMDFFLECEDMTRLVPFVTSHVASSSPEDDYTNDPEYLRIRNQIKQSRFHKRYEKLHEVLCELVEEYSLVKFMTLDINNAESVGRVVARVDKANGYIFCNPKREGDAFENMFQCAVQNDREWKFEVLADVQEQFLDVYKDTIPELQRRGKGGGES